MSRLDSVIRRLSAQLDFLGWAVANAAPGAVLEIGLGNGRSYHHLREIAPGRGGVPEGRCFIPRDHDTLRFAREEIHNIGDKVGS